MQTTSLQGEPQVDAGRLGREFDRTSYSAPTEALTPRDFRTATLDAAHEALLTIINRLFYLGQLLEVAEEYGYPLDNVVSPQELATSTDSLLEIAERIQSHRGADAHDLALQHGR